MAAAARAANHDCLTAGPRLRALDGDTDAEHDDRGARAPHGATAA